MLLPRLLNSMSSLHTVSTNPGASVDARGPRRGQRPCRAARRLPVKASARPDRAGAPATPNRQACAGSFADRKQAKETYSARSSPFTFPACRRCDRAPRPVKKPYRTVTCFLPLGFIYLFIYLFLHDKRVRVLLRGVGETGKRKEVGRF